MVKALFTKAARFDIAAVVENGKCIRVLEHARSLVRMAGQSKDVIKPGFHVEFVALPRGVFYLFLDKEPRKMDTRDPRKKPITRKSSIVFSAFQR
jgi:hypothetical protein